MSIYCYYVYAYIRSKDSKTAKAGTPYYIGKGKNNRMFSKRHSVPIPNNKQYIIVLESNLSDIGACALERRYIKWYGRVDNNTGILRNLTDGGDGTSGRIHSIETRKKIIKSNKTRTITLETRKKMSNSKKGNIFAIDPHGNVVITNKNDPLWISGYLSGIRKNSKNQSKRYNLYYYNLLYSNITFEKLKNIILEYNLSMSSLYAYMNNTYSKRGKNKGWMLERLDVIK